MVSKTIIVAGGAGAEITIVVDEIWTKALQ